MFFLDINQAVGVENNVNWNQFSKESEMKFIDDYKSKYIKIPEKPQAVAVASQGELIKAKAKDD